MLERHQTERSKARRESKRRRTRDRKITASARRAVRELRTDMKNMKPASRGPRKFSANGAGRKYGATKRLVHAPVFKHPKTELEAAIQRYVDLFEFAPIAYVSFDRVGRIEEINLAAAQLLGGSRARLIGEPFALRVTKEDRGRFLDHLLRCRSSESRVETELHLEKRNGEIILAHLASSPITSSMTEGALLYQTAIVDLTERKLAEEALRKSEEHLRAIINQSNAGIASCDLNGRFLFTNQKFREMLGYTDSELAARTIFTVTHPDDIHTTKSRFEKMVQTKHAVEFEKRYMRKDRSSIWVNVCDTPVLDAAGKPVSVVAVAVDITERRRAEAALQRANKLLEVRVLQRTKALRMTNAELKYEIERRKGLEGEILSLSDREQQRLGQELHDGLCQHLTAVAFMARSVALRLKNHRVIEVSDIEKIADLVNNAAADTRNLSRALHRVDVDSAGLVEALRDLVDREIWKIPCRLVVRPSFHIEDDAAASQLYRIAREAVINANKHAQAREIVIKLERSSEGMVMYVSDDGVGFPTEGKLKHGLGCHIMNYRAQLIGGRLKIERPKKGGTCVSCYFPDSTLKPKEPNKKKNGRQSRFPTKLTKAVAALI
jgi:PAS domain S-box-containing protein